MFFYQFTKEELQNINNKDFENIYPPKHPCSERYNTGGQKYYLGISNQRLSYCERFFIKEKEEDLDNPIDLRSFTSDSILTHYILENDIDAIKGFIYWDEESLGYFGYINGNQVFRIHEQTDYLTAESLLEFEKGNEYYPGWKTHYIYPLKINFLVKNIKENE